MGRRQQDARAPASLITHPSILCVPNDSNENDNDNETKTTTNITKTINERRQAATTKAAQRQQRRRQRCNKCLQKRNKIEGKLINN